MDSLHVTTTLRRGSGYGYILFSGSEIHLNGNTRVKVTINGISDVRDAAQMYSGDYMVVFSREQLTVAQLKYGEKIRADIESVDSPPELSDLPPDLLGALEAVGLGEDFKRLSPEDQKKYFRWVLESPTLETRLSRINTILEDLKKIDPELPRGESL
jgi:hypothetical protein